MNEESVFLIPLTNVPQTFDISLAGVIYTITCKYNSADFGGWAIDIVDAASGNPLIYNIPLVTGTDLLRGLAYLGIQGQMYVYTNGDNTAVPTLENLGVDSNVYFVTSVPNG